MDYELAKELADVGFPQAGKGAWAFPPDAIVARSRDRMYVPTLSELVEACGECGFAFYQTKGGWLARSTFHDTQVEAAIPEEAVARLWLALNKMNETGHTSVVSR